MTREFTSARAVRANVPLLIALIGPSTSGKTWSAHRLARGIQRVQPGPIHGIDTENEGTRMLELADEFEFEHTPFVAPFGSLDYLAAVQHCVKRGARTIIIDSMSHEHDGPGGCLESHDAEIVRRMLRYDDLKPGTREYERQAEKLNTSAWIVPKANRRKLIQGLLQLRVNVIMCFRAQEKSKPEGGKIKDLGWMPIGGDAFWFEMTARMLLEPGANGVPTWNVDREKSGSALAIRCPRQFQRILTPGRQISEDMGEQMARWASGEDSAKAEPTGATVYGLGNKVIAATAGPRARMLSETLTLEQALEALGAAKSADDLRAMANDLRAGTWDANQRTRIQKAINDRKAALKEGK